MEKLVLVLTGRKGSGKSEAAQILSKMGFDVVSSSSVLYDIMAKSKIKVNDKNVRAFIKKGAARLQREIAKEDLRRINESESKKIVLEAIRTKKQYLYLKRRRLKFVLIAIVSSPEERLKRMSDRRRGDDLKDLNALFSFQEEIEDKSLGIGDTIALADYTMENNGSYESFLRSIKIMLRKVKTNPH